MRFPIGVLAVLVAFATLNYGGEAAAQEGESGAGESPLSGNSGGGSDSGGGDALERAFSEALAEIAAGKTDPQATPTASAPAAGSAPGGSVERVATVGERGAGETRSRGAEAVGVAGEARAPRPQTERRPATEGEPPRARPTKTRSRASSAAKTRARTKTAKAGAPRKLAIGPVGYDEEGNQGRIHVVVDGDTLWDVSATYLATPWVWPSIWEFNPEVENPHRIYPGDRIWITPSQMRRLSEAEAEDYLSRGTAGSEDDGLLADLDDSSSPPMESLFVTPPNLHYKQSGPVAFVSAEEYEGTAAILGSPIAVEKYGPRPLSIDTFGFLQSVYIGLGRGQVEVGDRFSMFRKEEPVRDPDTGEELGVIIKPLGWLEVTRVAEESAEATIRSALAEVHPGDRLLPFQAPEWDRVMQEAPGDLDGRVIHFPGRRILGAESSLVILDRGSKDGVAPGQILEVYRPRGPLYDPFQERDVHLPERLIAELVVVRAGPSTATALVARSELSVERGDRIRAVRR